MAFVVLNGVSLQYYYVLWIFTFGLELEFRKKNIIDVLGLEIKNK